MNPEQQGNLPLQIRRVVTGHDASGRARVEVEEVASTTSRRPGHAAAVIWTSAGYPADNYGPAPARPLEVGSTLADGSVFRIVSYGPGVDGRRHRTESIDYAVVMSGEIDMELDGGVLVHLRAGDVLVQRGTIHNWVNSGPETCVIAFVLIDAAPVEVNGEKLTAVG